MLWIHEGNFNIAFILLLFEKIAIGNLLKLIHIDTRTKSLNFDLIVFIVDFQ